MGNARDKIKKLCKMEGLTIKKLCEKCSYNPQLAYNALRRDRIPKAFAEGIIEEFPYVREEWLLDPSQGAENFMTLEEIRAAREKEYNDGMEQIQTRLLAFSRILKTMGYSLSCEQNKNGELFYQFSLLEKPDVYECSPDAFKDLYDDIMGYIEFRMGRFTVLKCERSADNG